MLVTTNGERIDRVVIDDWRELKALIEFAKAVEKQPNLHLTTEQLLVAAQKFVRNWDEKEQYNEGHPDDDLRFEDEIWSLVESEAKRMKT